MFIEGDRLPPGKKSLAIEVVFQPRERTLNDAEIEAASAEGGRGGGEGDGRHAALMAGSSPATGRRRSVVPREARRPEPWRSRDPSCR